MAVMFIRSRDPVLGGNTALELVQRLAQTIASAEIYRELQLQKVLADIKMAEEQTAALQERTALAERRGNEAEYWLTRVYAKLEQELGPARWQAPA